MAHAALSRKTLTSLGVTESAISILAGRKICPRTSQKGLCQVYDGRYKFLLVTNLGGH